VRATRRRCQRSRVSGLTKKQDQRDRGRMRLIAASSARSAGSSLGRGVWRCNTASWWRRTRFPAPWRHHRGRAARAAGSNDTASDRQVWAAPGVASASGSRKRHGTDPASTDRQATAQIRVSAPYGGKNCGQPQPQTEATSDVSARRRIEACRRAKPAQRRKEEGTGRTEGTPCGAAGRNTALPAGSSLARRTWRLEVPARSNPTATRQ
jgi:hypothetical protein